MQVNCLGTPQFAAPEAWCWQLLRKSDVWSLACIAWSLLTLQQPWHGLTLSNILEEVRDKGNSLDIAAVDQDTQRLMPEVITLMQRSFHVDAYQRPSAAEWVAVLDSAIAALT
jgi:serine/threonine protein kinase